MLPSTASVVVFITTNDLGQLAAPGSLPTAVLYRNGVSSGVTVTVTNVSTGIYKAAFTTGAWSHGDVLQLLVTASIDSVSYTQIAWDGEINESGGGGLDAAGVRSAVGLASANLDTQLSTIDTVADGIKAKTDSLTFTTAGQVDSRVMSMADNTVTAAAAAADFIGAAEIAASASQEIADLIAQDWIAGDASPIAIASAVWSAATRTLTANPGLDAAGIRSAVGLTSANLETLLTTIDTVADGIKAKTDQFVFTIANQVDANALTGGGGGGGGSGDATEAKQDTIIAALAVVDGVADAIKAKTDSLTFTVAGQVDSRVMSMADNSMTAAAAASDFIGAAEIAASASAEIADLIAQDWVAGDGSPLAIAAAVWADADAATAIRSAVGLAAADLDDQLSEVKGPRVLSAILPGADEAEGLYFEMTELDDYSADNDRGPIGPITVQTAIDLTDPSVRLRFGATQMLGSRLSPTVKFIGTATATATAEANVYDVHISIPRTETAGKPSGFYRWDVEAVLDLAVDNVVTLTPETNRLLLHPSLGDNEDRDPLGAP